MSSDRKISVHYAFTITLRPKCFTHEPEKQYDDTAKYIMDKLQALCYSVTLVAEATKSFNVHFHGICNFVLHRTLEKNCMKGFHKCFRNDNLVGFVNIRQIDNMEKWKDYIKKDIASTTDSINRRPIILDDYDVFNSDEREAYGCTW